MLIGKVIGSIWATKKLDSFEGKKLLLVQPFDENLKPENRYIVAVDTVQAGKGDIIFYATSKEAAIPFKNDNMPADAAIVGIIDGFSL
ncbi:ethanolamine utilization protein EutN [Thermotomaculum hydrothermale]|uniref:Ethanolamine utilization protein EutN n=1 Tax=Thermotomaculum hydrothermale TaxID=981385 RepID=A0A7R6PSG2_9BACT|nr:EutN/CcmL family microcompartment protein [Thermotomaculum hydrothermale]BBB33491.1 ethanolamine utilization protein EutN [Thermotomaculum hydrothermale]